MKICITFSILFILSSVSLAQNCNLYNDITGDYYDFTLLSDKPLSFQIDNKFYLFSICNISSFCSQSNLKVSACYISDRNINTIGYLDNYKINTLDNKQGGSIIYENYSNKCPNSSSKTTIEMICDLSSNTSIDSITTDSATCNYNIRMRSSLACPIKKRLSTFVDYKNITYKTSKLECQNGYFMDKGCICFGGFTGNDCSESITILPTQPTIINTTSSDNSTFSSITTNYYVGNDSIIETNTTRYSSLTLISNTHTVTTSNETRSSTITTTSIYNSDGSVTITKFTITVNGKNVTATIEKEPPEDINNAMKMVNVSKSFILSVVLLSFIILI